MTAIELTPAERAEVETKMAALRERGYVDREAFNELKPGTRIRHRGHQWPDAYREGTGNVVAITEKPESAWSQSWGAPDVEMVVAYDEPTLPGMSRLVTLAQYHVSAVDGEW